MPEDATIDPAVIDLMHQMSQHPPAVVQEVAAPSRGTDRAELWAKTVGERNVRAFEHAIARWIAETERQLAELVDDFAQAEIRPHHLIQLTQMIAISESVRDKEAKAYTRIAKRARRLSKQAQAVSPQFSATFEAQRDRFLRGLARWGIARSDFILVLRSLRAEHDPAARGGPAFDDARELGGYLRTAVA